MPNPSAFGPASTERIARAVQTVERGIRPTSPRRGRTPQILQAPSWSLYEIVDAGPQYDATEKAYKVQARLVPDETADGELFDLTAVAEADKQWLWFPRAWSWDDGPDTGVPFYWSYLRVYAIERGGRKEIVLPAGYRQNHWLRGYLYYDDVTFPAFGVVKLVTHNIHPDLNDEDDLDLKHQVAVRQVQDFIADDTTAHYALLGPRGGARGEMVPVTEARQQPAWGYRETYSDPAIGFGSSGIGYLWGPAPGSFALWPGLPGFREVGPTAGERETKLRVEPYLDGVYLAVATENWTNVVGTSNHHYVNARPRLSYPGVLCDGSSYYGLELPDITMKLYLPIVGYLNTGSARKTTRHPNVVAGDVLHYRVMRFCPDEDDTAAYRCVVVDDYTDDAIGTVKLWCGDPDDIPVGWALMNGTDNATANGGSGLDLRGRFVAGYDAADYDYSPVGETGGAQTHTHGSEAGTAFASGSRALLEADHRPPYLVLAYIERLDNSA